MDYGQGISGCFVGAIPQTITGSGYEGVHSKQLKEELLATLLEHPILTHKLGYLTSGNKLTPLASKELLVGLAIDRNKCFGNTPQWKLDWYN